MGLGHAPSVFWHKYGHPPFPEYARLQLEARTALSPWCREDGSVEFDTPALVVTAPRQ